MLPREAPVDSCARRQGVQACVPEFDVSGLLVDRMLQPGYLLFRELIPYFGSHMHKLFWLIYSFSHFGSSILFRTCDGVYATEPYYFRIL